MSHIETIVNGEVNVEVINHVVNTASEFVNNIKEHPRYHSIVDTFKNKLSNDVLEPFLMRDTCLATYVCDVIPKQTIAYHMNLIQAIRTRANCCALHACLHALSNLTCFVQMLDVDNSLTRCLKQLNDKGFDMNQYVEHDMFIELKHSFDFRCSGELGTINSDVCEVMRMLGDILTVCSGCKPGIIEFMFRTADIVKKEVSYEEKVFEESVCENDTHDGNDHGCIYDNVFEDEGSGYEFEEDDCEFDDSDEDDEETDDSMFEDSEDEEDVESEIDDEQEEDGEEMESVEIVVQDWDEDDDVMNDIANYDLDDYTANDKCLTTNREIDTETMLRDKSLMREYEAICAITNTKLDDIINDVENQYLDNDTQRKPSNIDSQNVIGFEDSADDITCQNIKPTYLEDVYNISSSESDLTSHIEERANEQPMSQTPTRAYKRLIKTVTTTTTPMNFNISDLQSINVDPRPLCVSANATLSQKDHAEQARIVYNIATYKPLYVVADIAVLRFVLGANTNVIRNFVLGDLKYELTGVIEHVGWHYVFTMLINDRLKKYVVYDDLSSKLYVKDDAQINWDECSVYVFRRVK